MMSWQAWSPPEGWPVGAPSVRWQRLPLGDGHEACLWLFDLDITLPAANAAPAMLTACLSEEEQARAQRFRQALHGDRHRVARAMVRHLLGHLSQRAAASLSWHTGPHGKPALLELDPILTTGHAHDLRFNLSHSGRWALLATSFTRELGVDIEERASRAHLSEMAERILSVEERGHLACTPSTATHTARHTDTLLQAWTRKEACLKALGTGLTREMDTLTLDATHARTANAHLGALGPLPKLGWADITLPADCPAWAACAWIAPDQTATNHHQPLRR